MKDWKQRYDKEMAEEISAELVRLGFVPGEAFYVSFFDDGRLCAVHLADDAVRAQPWGPEIHYA